MLTRHSAAVDYVRVKMATMTMPVHTSHIIHGYAPSTPVLSKTSEDGNPCISSLLDLWETYEQYQVIQRKEIHSDDDTEMSIAAPTATPPSELTKVAPFQKLYVWTGERKGSWTKIINITKCPNTKPIVRVKHISSGATIDVCSGHHADYFIEGKKAYPYISQPNWMYCEDNPLLSARRLLDAVSQAQGKARDREYDGLGELDWSASEVERREVYKAFVEIRCISLRGKSYTYNEYHLEKELHFQLDSQTSAAQWALFANTLGVVLVLADAPTDAPTPKEYEDEWVWVRTYPSKTEDNDNSAPSSQGVSNRFINGVQPSNATAQTRLPGNIPTHIFNLETENGYFCAGVGNLLVQTK